MDATPIKDLMQLYFDANYESDAEKIAQVFHEQANVYGHVQGGDFSQFNKKSFVELIASLEPLTNPRADEILAIDFIGENAAACRVRLRVEEIVYTDILNFVRIDGKWGIISKIYSGEPV